ncbi:MAG: murein biosynthesis integral membrane protein MurJ [Spirochaetia bacterium]|jgi:putative peptidoglycan lipid II flippase|nr:murein biosynthesis integral membrane protein MurJ [Spirochaetia bacterium]
MKTAAANIQKTSLSAISVMICTFISRILGFLRVAVIGAYFGATGEADVLNSVFSVPNNLRKLMAEGALSSAFIPVLTESLIKEKELLSTKRLVRNILTFQVVILVPVCILSIVFSDFLINSILFEFSDPYLQNLAVLLFRWFISYLLLISISAVIMAVLNSKNYFFIPAITPILFSITVITSVVFLYKSMGIFSMVVGVLTGGILQIVFQLPVYFKEGFDFKPDFNFKSIYFKKIMRNWFPVVATASIFAVNQQIAMRFASGLETGSSSALSYAIVFWQLPFGIFSASITTVLFPKMSKFSAADKRKELLDTMNTGVINLYSLLLPSTLFLFIMGPEMVSIAMQRGSFTPENTFLTSFVLKGFAPGLFIIGFFNFMQRFYYSVHNYRKPFIYAVIVCIIDVFLSLILKETPLRVCGLAVANSLAFAAGALLMLFDIKTSWKDYNFKKLVLNKLKITISIILPSAALIYSRMFFGDLWKKGITVPLLFYFFIAVIVFSSTVLLSYAILKVDFIFFRKRRLA